MRQRVMIAMALANDPELLIADEPTTALDVTVQAQILDADRASCSSGTGMAVLLITHDLGVVARDGGRRRGDVRGADRRVRAPTRDLFREPKHPYTQGLFASLPTGAAAARTGDAGGDRAGPDRLAARAAASSRAARTAGTSLRHASPPSWAEPRPGTAVALPSLPAGIDGPEPPGSAAPRWQGTGARG